MEQNMDAIKNDLLSVIIPVYNAEKYISAMIEDLLDQTYKNIEIILVDDGSTDTSGQICDMYAQRQKRICAIHQKNGGVATARNAGLEAATGNLIAFVDADDRLEAYTYEILVQALKETKSDFAACGFSVEYGTNIERSSKKPTMPTPFVYDSTESIWGGVGARERDLAGYVWNKVFRRGLIGDIRCRLDIPISDDLVFVNEIIARSKRAVYVDLPLYHYRYVATSISQTGSKIEKYIQCLAGMRRLITWRYEDAPVNIESLIKTYLFWNVKTCEQMLRQKDEEAYKTVQKNIAEFEQYIPLCGLRIRVLARAILISWQAYRPLGLLVWNMKQIYIAVHRWK